MPVPFVRLVALIVMLLTAVAAPAAQIDDQPEVVALFDQVEEQLHGGNWQAARQLCDQLLTRYPNSPHRDLFLYSEGKAWFYAGEYQAAQSDFDALLKQFPTSPLAPYAIYFWANTAIPLGKPAAAVPAYIRAYSLTDELRLQRLLVNAISAIDGVTLHQLLSKDSLASLSETKQCSLVRGVAEQLLAHQRIDDAGYVRSLCPSSGTEANTPPDTLGHIIRIGVLVPLSGEYQEYGEQILNGAAVAIQQMLQVAGRKIVLSPFDTQGDPIAAGRIVRELAKLNYDAVIGPLTSEEASVVAAASASGIMPVLIPAATGAGLTLLSSDVFQLVPNIELQGIQMAEYAYRNLGADSAVIMTPTATDYLQVAQAFATRFESLGGKIIAVEYYRSSDRDFGSHILSVKSLVQTGIDSSAVYLSPHGDTLDAKAIPAQVDCIFMPGAPDQLKLLISQLRYYNLNGAYLGGDGWGSDQIFALGDDVCRGAVFASPFLQQIGEQQEFVKSFAAVHGEAPTRLASLGYDAVGLLRRALERAPVTRQDWLAELTRTANYNGAAGRITFGRYRENVDLPVYKISSGRPILVGISQSAPSGIRQ